MQGKVTQDTKGSGLPEERVSAETITRGHTSNKTHTKISLDFNFEIQSLQCHINKKRNLGAEIPNQLGK